MRGRGGKEGSARRRPPAARCPPRYCWGRRRRCSAMAAAPLRASAAPRSPAGPRARPAPPRARPEPAAAPPPGPAPPRRKGRPGAEPPAPRPLLPAGEPGPPPRCSGGAFSSGPCNSKQGARSPARFQRRSQRRCQGRLQLLETLLRRLNATVGLARTSAVTKTETTARPKRCKYFFGPSTLDLLPLTTSESRGFKNRRRVGKALHF